MDKQTRKYFRREFSKRTALGAWLDRLLAGAFFVALSYMWFLRRVRSYAAALFLSVIFAGVVIAAVAFVQRLRFERFVRLHTAKLKKEALLYAVTMLTQNQITDMLAKSDESLKDVRAIDVRDCGFVANCDGERTLCAVLLKHPAEHVTASEILSLYRKAKLFACSKLRVYPTAPLCEQATATMERLEIPAKALAPDDVLRLCELADLLPTDEYAADAIKAETSKKRAARSALKKDALSRPAARRFAVAGTAILAASFVTGSTLYYPVMAGLCFAFAIISYAFGAHSSMK